jgi:hypothetical protein
MVVGIDETGEGEGILEGQLACGGWWLKKGRMRGAGA